MIGITKRQIDRNLIMVDGKLVHKASGNVHQKKIETGDYVLGPIGTNFLVTWSKYNASPGIDTEDTANYTHSDYLERNP